MTVERIFSIILITIGLGLYWEARERNHLLFEMEQSQLEFLIKTWERVNVDGR